jgi:GNAT superfamily N-acetyltransferase
VNAPALFTAGPYRAVELGEGDIPALQRFYEANPAYHLAVGGQPPGAGEARRDFEEGPPAGWPYRKRWLLGFVDGDGSMIGTADVVSDLLAQGVWHIGLFFVATSLHGSGVSRELYERLEAWMRAGGARWVRLGVVEGNARAERFWERSGFAEVRKRHGIEFGRRVRTVRIMTKPLAKGSLPEYLGLVARDRPEAA